MMLDAYGKAYFPVAVHARGRGAGEPRSVEVALCSGGGTEVRLRRS